MKVTLTYLVIVCAVCVFAGAMLFKCGCKERAGVNSTSEEIIDSIVSVRLKQKLAEIPAAKLERAVAGRMLGSRRVEQQSIASDSLPFLDTVLYEDVLVPRSDTLKTGEFAIDTLSFFQFQNTIWNIEIKHAPSLVYYYDTLIFVRDSVTRRDSLVIQERPRFSLEIKTGLRYPISTIGNILAYGAEFSYVKGPWVYSLEPFMQSFHPGVALWIKYTVL